MPTVISKDGTRIAYDQSGQGPAVILVAGALCARLGWHGPALARLLAPHFTVYNYDRRGRGDSTDTQPYAVEREIEDLAALIAAAGGTASLYGHSSGAALALDTAARLPGQVTKLAMYEAPYNDAPEARLAWAAYLRQLAELLAANRRGDAVALFMAYVGTPASQIAGMRQAPSWKNLEALAPTLAYDHTGIMGPTDAVPVAQAASVKTPALVMSGDAGAPFMPITARALAAAMPRAQLRFLSGENHNVKPEVLAPVLEEFLRA